jgi:hypothetical protein
MFYTYNKEFIKRFGFNCLYTPLSLTYFIKKRLKVNITLVFLGLLDI